MGDVAVDRLTEPVLADRLGAKVSCEAVLRVLAMAWFAPAAAQFVLGAMVAFDLSPAVASNSGRYLELIWSSIVGLGIVTLLVGMMWVVRYWPQIPTASSVSSARVHLAAATVAVVFVPLAFLARSAAPGLLGVTLVALAGSALVAASFAPRWMLLGPHAMVGPLSAFTGLVVWHLTVGWLHLLGPTLSSSLVLVWQGAMLAIASVTTARLLPRFTVTPLAVPVLTPELNAELEQIEASVLGMTVD